MILAARTPIYPNMPNLDKYRAAASEAGSITALRSLNPDIFENYYKALCATIYRLNVSRLQAGLGFNKTIRSIDYVSPGSKEGIARARAATIARFARAAERDRTLRTDQQIIDEYNRVMGRTDADDPTDTAK
jgi:hypothetical protein